MSPTDRAARASSVRLRFPLPSCRRLLRKMPVTAPVGLMVIGGLVNEGWLRSFRETQSVDRRGEPVPWYTYPCTNFLRPRLRTDMRVFEFGAGLSTLWYAARVREVVAVEHDEAWAQRVGGRLPANATLLLRPDEDDYVGAVDGYGPFDVVAVDGMARARCAERAVSRLSEGGVIVWDNADWVDFHATLPAMAQHGFRSISFRGMGPINRQDWETAVLYRDGNCLGI